MQSINGNFRKVVKESVQVKGPKHLNLTDETILNKLIANHHQFTNSTIAGDILNKWEASIEKFVKVMPNEYRRALDELHAQTIKEVA